MRERFRWFLLIWTMLWMGVVMPGHERGLVRVPGASSCCPRPDAPPPTCHAAPGQSAPCESDPSAKCGVCELLARIDAPAPSLFYLTFTVLGIQRPERAPARVDRRVLLPFDTRGPPMPFVG